MSTCGIAGINTTTNNQSTLVFISLKNGFIFSICIPAQVTVQADGVAIFVLSNTDSPTSMDRQVFLLILQSRVDCTTGNKLAIVLFYLASTNRIAPGILVILFIR